MDEVFERVLAPRRNKGRCTVHEFKDDAVWADTLDWQTNDYDLCRLFLRQFERLDADYRYASGIRLDQLADRSELLVEGWRAASWYREADDQYRTVGVYGYLHGAFDKICRNRARRLMRERQKLAGDCSS